MPAGLTPIIKNMFGLILWGIVILLMMIIISPGFFAVLLLSLLAFGLVWLLIEWVMDQLEK